MALSPPRYIPFNQKVFQFYITMYDMILVTMINCQQHLLEYGLNSFPSKVSTIGIAIHVSFEIELHAL